MTRDLARFLTLALVLLAAPAHSQAETPVVPVDYNRDVRQILSNHCYTCHGPDEKKRAAGLRLDKHEGALAALESGQRAIVPGNIADSQLIARIISDDESTRMPPPEGGKPLKPAEIEILKRWVAEGAAWKGHWSYLKIERPTLPSPVSAGNSPAPWGINQVDQFILQKLQADGLQPNAEADKPTLIRRLSFDLTGLPPTLAEVDAFVSDARPDAYERLVDRLLASPRYGERMAQKWLDLARYADTNGYHIDNHRDMWLYRQWVIDAFNRNLPFDRFAVEQLAGDLLPGATVDQQIASGFHRNVMVNFEGGADPKEYLTKYIVDRVTTTATVFLGSTLACAECHDHKYDPFTQRDFYQMYAYFNNVPEQGLDGQKENPRPSLRIPTSEQQLQLDGLASKIAQLEKQASEELAKVKVDPAAEPVSLAESHREFVWVDDALPEGSTPDGAEQNKSWKFVDSPAPVLEGRRASERTANGLSQHFFTGARRPLVIGEGDKLVAHVWLDPANPPEEVMLQFNDGQSWDHRAYWGGNKIEWGGADSPSRRAMGALPGVGRWARLEVEASAVGLTPGTTVDGWACTQFGGHVFWDKLALVSRMPQGPALDQNQSTWELAERSRKSSPAPEAVRDALKTSADKRSPEQQQAIRDYFVRYSYTATRGIFDPINRQIRELNNQRTEMEKAFPATMVMQEMPERRSTFVLTRGDFRSEGEKVEPGVPASLPPLPTGAAANRLGLAQWIVDPKNPLVARVTVNRFWQQYFGTGIVKTSEDFGSQGEWPTHVELLDWLASYFIESGWDIKGMQKLIVMSATYRQSAKVDPEKLKHDPYNRLLARGARFRLDAEMIRDNALSISGLLDDRIGGPSVSPYQPAGLWEEVGFGDSFSAQSYKQSHGRDLYRRGIYTYWKRALPYPPLVTFDAPNREVCTDNRARTNTPLQALVLLNDPAYIEAARVLAARMMKDGGTTADERIAFAFKLCTARSPETVEADVLRKVFDAQLARFKQDPESAKKLLSVGESARPADLDASELAAWTAVANVLLNLDETITKG